jgi:hypothetical protein
MGFSRMYLNEAKEARQDSDSSARAAALVGQPRAELLGEVLGAFARSEVGDYDGMSICIDRSLRLARQLGARRFEAQGLEMRGRLLLAKDRQKDADEVLREGLAICREVGVQFCGPKIIGALSRVVADPAERAALLAEGAEMLKRGAVSHNHFWFHRDAIEALLAARDAEGVMHHVKSLEEYTHGEPLPWSNLFAARGRALAGSLAKDSERDWRDELTRVREELVSAGYRPYLPSVEAALAA